MSSKPWTKTAAALLWSIPDSVARITMSIASLSSSVKISSATVAANVTMSSVIGATLCSFKRRPLLSFSGSVSRAAAKSFKRKT